MELKIKTQTIMIVDDEPSNIKVAGAILKELKNIKIIAVTNGAEALKIINDKDTQIDIVLLDIMMPQMSGYEVCKQLKANEDTKDIPVIFMSALDDEISEEKGLLLGALDYIRKPFSFAITKARISNYLKLKAYQDAISVAALIDQLTQIPNRRNFENVYEREYAKAKRNCETLSCLMIDIDYFKNYNDYYGHIMGDKCIQSVALALQKSLLREVDFCARYGGEEFVVILPNSDSASALTVAQRILQAICELKIEHAKSKVLDIVTVSIGCASVNGGMLQNQINIIKLADEALYKAKTNGRNMIESV